MKIKIKKLSENAVIPTYAKNGDAGMDITATSVEEAELYISYGTGLAFEIPEGYVGLLFQRSSVSKTALSLANAVGVLDSGYRGEVSYRFKKVLNGPVYKVGDKIGQIMILPYPKIELEEVTELSSSERGSGGYGSTGN